MTWRSLISYSSFYSGPVDVVLFVSRILHCGQFEFCNPRTLNSRVFIAQPGRNHVKRTEAATQCVHCVAASNLTLEWPGIQQLSQNRH